MSAIERLEKELGKKLDQLESHSNTVFLRNIEIGAVDAEAWLELARAAWKYRRGATSQTLARFNAALRSLQEDTP